ncbi:MAG: diaminopimelate epimerase [Planctomyces sp.]|nr:diaminopimelate epimerase [Planctomyces sp.]MBA4119392.1 diaminopimelate epimerase [Isosphaera sp.]
MRAIKMHGAGNDYLYLDAVSQPQLEHRSDLPELVRAMSHRHTGVGSDGVILVARPTPAAAAAGATVRMRMFNADASEGAMCGNGVRCVAKFAHERLGNRQDPMLVETGRGVLALRVLPGGGRVERVTVDMGAPILDPARIPTTLRGGPRGVLDAPVPPDAPADLRQGLDAAGHDGLVCALSMGNPHAVFFCAQAQAVPLERAGPAAETWPAFPGRVNAHFVRRLAPDRALVRTWERGSGATMACGTGACAVLVAGVLTGRLNRAAVIELPGGELRIEWPSDDAGVLMTGPAQEVCEVLWPADAPADA